MLKEKDKDIILAAEIGQSLLESNDKLKLEYELAMQALRERTALDGEAFETPDSSAKWENERNELYSQLAELERSNLDLQERLEQTLQKAGDNDRESDKKVKQAEAQLLAVTKELENQLRRNDDLEENNKRLANEKNELIKGKKKFDGKDEQLEKVQILAHDLECTVKALSTNKQELEAKLFAVISENNILQEKLMRFEEEMEEYHSLQDQYQEQNNELSSATYALEEARETIMALENRISVIEPESQKGPDRAGVTLFDEVEDRRQELENKHQHLSQKHAGLLKAHTMTIHQQERMKNHISRLTQLSHNRSNEEKMRRLEQALGQTQSENKMLMNRISQLERSSDLDQFEYAVSGSHQGNTNGQNGGSLDEKNELIDCLRLRVDQLSDETESLRRELRTGQMLKLSLDEKIMELEGLLHEREYELDHTRTVNAQVKFELDELKLKHKIMKDNQLSALEEEHIPRGVQETKQEPSSPPQPMQTTLHTKSPDHVENDQQMAPKLTESPVDKMLPKARSLFDELTAVDNTNEAGSINSEAQEDEESDEDMVVVNKPSPVRSIMTDEFDQSGEPIDEQEPIEHQPSTPVSKPHQEDSPELEEDEFSDQEENVHFVKSDGGPKIKSPHPRKLGFAANSPSTKPKQYHVRSQKANPNECNQQ
ncbi:hypothetical protein K493DRAFT_333833 [Basidiobolus meristosporus CBS 931.73]|uniref:Uncharacterized protein n=1 Tax=Basidiobolus meristosporus CBS 931.73 TaxID=1314790 RepID=A0A1Y1Z374_9FUNG|nr:hypothetical protein K493DRAFT_333833 [Basidiobolus meristosporus CBS 931.73]|eukprot:ORY04738.1 hypothetical protein K493DRAFT_333833 [Basidiobolus meristosporus CBS 931.73]